MLSSYSNSNALYTSVTFTSGFLYILYLNTLWLEVNTLNLELVNQAKNIPVVLPSLPIKFEANRSSGS